MSIRPLRVTPFPERIFPAGPLRQSINFSLKLSDAVIIVDNSNNYLKHKVGDFAVTDKHTKKIISFPCDQHLTLSQMNYIIKTVKRFYEKK